VAYAAAQRLADAGVIAWTGGRITLRDPAPAWRSLREPAGGSHHDAAALLRAANDRRLAQAFSGADLIITPTTPTRPHGHDGPGPVMNVSLTWAFNLSGHPAITVPAGFCADGTPVGLQLIATHQAEATLLQVAHRFERLQPWPRPALDDDRRIQDA
jgi:Asp-tRNA(Asn)/Glu-tRNA(Gln) amidotransferase A subunit family amidase